MASLNHFTIPVKGLKTGIHPYEFVLDKDFFVEFENSPVENAQITVKLDFDKRPNMFVLDAVISGTVAAECDRCLAEIDLPLPSEQQLIIKLTETQKEDDEEVVYLPIDTTEVNIAIYLYEFVCLSIPMIKTCDDAFGEPDSCDPEITKHLFEGEQEEEETPANNNSVWDALKNLDIKK